MVRTPDKKRTGLFLLIGTIVFLLIFGIYLKRFFWNSGNNIVVMYFQESIKGLFSAFISNAFSGAADFNKRRQRRFGS